MALKASIFDVGLWMASVSIIIILTSELLSSSKYSSSLALNFKRMRLIGLFFGTGFMVFVIIQALLTI